MRTCTRRLFPAFLSSDNLPSTSVILKGKKKNPNHLVLEKLAGGQRVICKQLCVHTTIFKYSGSIFRPQTISALSAGV